MKKKKSSLLKYTKETPEAHKKRVSSGVNLRTLVIENKKRKLKDNPENDDYLE
ncbi:MAG: hypothetical protein AB9835_12320 [Eubacteriales bacterium]